MSRSSCDALLNGLIMAPGGVAGYDSLQGLSLNLRGHSRVVKLFSINHGLLLMPPLNCLRLQLQR